MLNASPLMQGEGKGLSLVTVAPARADAKVFCGCTGAADCTMAVMDGAISDIHGQGHVYAI